MNLRIVVGMSVWNEERYLRDTIPAILAQTMPDFQLFILDNGSTDGSWRMLRDLQAYDGPQSRINLVRSPRNLRAPEAANLGFHAMMEFWPDCRWFMGQGADDIMDPDYLEAILAAADANPGVNCIFSPAKFIGQSNVWRYPPYDAARAHENLYVPGWRAITRELWNTVGPEYTGINEGSDWEWIARASRMRALVPYQLDTPKLARRIRTERKSSSDLADKPALLKHMRAMVGR